MLSETRAKLDYYGIIAVLVLCGIGMFASMYLTGCDTGTGGGGGGGGGTDHEPYQALVDAQGREVGVVLGTTGTSTVVSKNGYTLLIRTTTGEISGYTIFATGTNGTGTVITLSYADSYYPNFIMKNNGEYYRFKNRDADGCPTGTSYSSFASSRGDGSSWTNYTRTDLESYYEIEKITGATDDVYFIGFTPTPPLTVVWK